MNQEFDFTLRRWNFNDLESLVKYADNECIARNLTDMFPHPYTRAHGEEFIHRTLEDDPARIMAIDFRGEAIGSIGIFPQTDVHRMNAEMGYWLAEPFWGKGIMSRAILKMTEYGFSTWSINRIFARPFGYNTASCRALEKAGFVLEARFQGTLIKNGKTEDELIYAIRR